MKTDILSQVKIFSVFIIMLFIVLVLGSAKMTGKNALQKSINNERAAEISETPVPLAEEEVKGENELAAMAYYKNEKYAFELQYPKAWSVEAGNPADIFIQPKTDKAGSLPIPHEGALEIKIRAVDRKAGLSKLTAQYSEDGIDAVVEKTEIGGVPALKITTSICRAENCRITEWFVLTNDHFYQISSIYPDIAYNKDFDRIIPTIKFLKSAE